MKRERLEHFRYNHHAPRYSRRQLGCAPISGRPTYAVSVKCKCGWELNWNEGRPETEKAWRQHSRAEWDKT